MYDEPSRPVEVCEVVEQSAVRTPPRPSVPPLAWVSGGVWGGVLFAESLAWRVFEGRVPEAAIAAVAFACAAGAAVAWRVRVAAAVLVCAGLAAGCVAGGAYWNAWRHDIASYARAPGPYTLITAHDARSGAFGPSVEGVVADATGVRRRVKAFFGRDEQAPELGQLTRVTGRLRPAQADERGRRMHQDGVSGTLSVNSRGQARWAPGVAGAIGHLRLRCVERVRRVPGDAGALLSGVLLGDRRLLADTPAEADFATAGLTHLVAVSGSHLVVVGALAAWLLDRLRVRRTAVMVAVVTVMAGYVVATGLQPSAVRALVMTVVAVGAVFGGRRADGIAALSCAVCLAFVVWPPVAFDLGFRLSVASVAGLLVFARLCGAWLEAALPGRVSALAQPLALTLVAQAVTFPLTAPVFGVVSLIAPVANLLVGPLVAAMLVVGLLGLAVGAASSMLGGAALHTAGALASLAVSIAGGLAGVAHAAVPVGEWWTIAAVAVVVAATAVWVLWPAPEHRAARLAASVAAFCLVVAVAGPPAPAGARVVVLDVGQGDAILIRDGPRTALVDTGPDAGALRAALARHDVRDLEWVALTHAHDDHTGGVPALAGAHRVGGVFVSDTDDEEAYARIGARLKAPVHELDPGTRLTLGALVVTVVWPQEPAEDASENDSSLVLHVEGLERTMLLTGDAEADVLEPLVRGGVLGPVDVLKVGHHGSRASLTSGVLAALRPKTAVISVGAENRFGHPTSEALEMLRTAGVGVSRTDLNGDVEVMMR